LEYEEVGYGYEKCCILQLQGWASRHNQESPGRSAAQAAAGELGQIWITESGKQRQVHMSSAGTWMTVEPDSYLAVDLKAALKTEGLIESNI